MEAELTYWSKIESPWQCFQMDGDCFALIIPVEESGHFAWYVIDDANGVLIGSGNTDLLEEAKQNCEECLRAGSLDETDKLASDGWIDRRTEKQAVLLRQGKNTVTWRYKGRKNLWITPKRLFLSRFFRFPVDK